MALTTERTDLDAILLKQINIGANLINVVNALKKETNANTVLFQLKVNSATTTSIEHAIVAPCHISNVNMIIDSAEPGTTIYIMKVEHADLSSTILTTFDDTNAVFGFLSKGANNVNFKCDYDMVIGDILKYRVVTAGTTSLILTAICTIDLI